MGRRASPVILRRRHRVVAVLCLVPFDYTTRCTGQLQPRRHDDAAVQPVIDATLNRTPPNATQWRARRLVAEPELPTEFVHQVWRAFGLRPHQVEKIKLSPSCQMRAARVGGATGRVDRLVVRQGESCPTDSRRIARSGGDGGGIRATR